METPCTFINKQPINTNNPKIQIASDLQYVNLTPLKIKYFNKNGFPTKKCDESENRLLSVGRQQFKSLHTHHRIAFRIQSRTPYGY